MTLVWCKSTCSTCRQALKFLRENEIPHTWRWTDREPPTETELRELFERHPRMELLNPRSTPWRKMALQEASLEQERAIQLVLEDVNLLRRPLLWLDQELHSGFRAESWQKLFKL